MKDANTFQRIEDYLNGALSDSENTIFEKELAENAALKKQVDLSKLTNQLVFENRLLNIKELAQAEHHNGTQKGNTGKIALISAAAILLSVGVYVGLNKPEEKQTLVAEKPAKTISSASESIPEKVEIQHSTSTENKKIEAERVATETKEPIAKSAEPKQAIISSTPESKPIAEQVVEKSEAKSLAIEENACANVKIEASHFIQNTCLGEKTGAIVFSKMKGGTAPYKIKLFSKENMVLEQKDHLAAGTYHAEISDASNCSTKFQELVVKEKACVKNYHFNPFTGETWEIPTYSSSGTITIFDKSGNVYFHKELNANDVENWSGQSAEGKLETGYYLFTISYADGTTSKGSISIVQ